MVRITSISELKADPAAGFLSLVFIFSLFDQGYSNDQLFSSFIILFLIIIFYGLDMSQSKA